MAISSISTRDADINAIRACAKVFRRYRVLDEDNTDAPIRPLTILVAHEQDRLPPATHRLFVYAVANLVLVTNQSTTILTLFRGVLASTLSSLALKELWYRIIIIDLIFTILELFIHSFHIYSTVSNALYHLASPRASVGAMLHSVARKVDPGATEQQKKYHKPELDGKKTARAKRTESDGEEMDDVDADANAGADGLPFSDQDTVW